LQKKNLHVTVKQTENAIENLEKDQFVKKRTGKSFGRCTHRRRKHHRKGRKHHKRHHHKKHHRRRHHKKHLTIEERIRLIQKKD